MRIGNGGTKVLRAAAPTGREVCASRAAFLFAAAADVSYQFAILSLNGFRETGLLFA
jgi:hypothetical protein